MNNCKKCNHDFNIKKRTCKKCITEEWKKWRLKNAEKYRNSRLKSLRKSKYGISDYEYNKLINDADGKCMICQKVLDKPCIDHDHNSGKVRGILC